MNFDNIEELNEGYNLQELDSFLKRRFRSNQINILNQLQTDFIWKSETVEIPRNLEILLRCKGLMGFIKKAGKFVKLSIQKYDNLNKPIEFTAIGLGTSPESYGTVTDKEVIPLYNNPLGCPDIWDINFYSYEKAQNDISRMYQLIYSRNIPMLKTDSDKVMKSIFKALDDIKVGKPAVVTTSLLDDIQELNILDPNNITKMEYLTSYDEVLDKNIANHFGASLDIKDKKAQVNNAELMAYQDITTMNYLVAYESRLEFCNNMKEEGFEIEVIKSPIFADEPTEEEIEDPELLDMEEGGEDSEEFPEEEKEEEENE